ncbi:cuticle protein 19-like [Oratosquilla oratoria]|uniref:cuticle protein 19-like n=1 Tax=Oratosquilla oratoria TaxID=337810 RepID=UPI003F764E8D
MPFDFQYAVNDQYSGNDFGHASNSDGEVTQGEYRVALPDGRTQIVSYKADDYSGYLAEVSYEGEATYPQQSPAPAYHPPAPAYQPPAPAYEAPAPTYGAP